MLMHAMVITGCGFIAISVGFDPLHIISPSRIGDFPYAIAGQFLAQMEVHMDKNSGTHTDFFIEGLNDVGMVVVTCRLC
jgi:hypothetical protein